jgi:hypothetical protein
MTDIVERLRGYAKDQGRRHNIEDTCEAAADEIERLREVLDILQDAMIAKKPIPMYLKQAINRARAALSPAPATDIQLPKGWLADEFSRVDADVAQWSSGMKDSFKEATGIAIPPAPSKGGDDE